MTPENERHMQTIKEGFMRAWRDTKFGEGHTFARLCMPRRIVPPPGNYDNIADYALHGWVKNLMVLKGQPLTKALEAELLQHALMRRAGMPSYYLDRAFGEAVWRTAPPPGVKLSDLRLPMPSFAVYPERNFTQEVFGVDVTSIIVTEMVQHIPDLVMLSTGETTELEPPEGGLLQIYVRYQKHGVGGHSLRGIPLSRLLTEAIATDDSPSLLSATELEAERQEFAKVSGQPLTQDAVAWEQEMIVLLEKTTSFALQLLMILNTRQDWFLSEGECVRAGKQKRSGAVDALWSANVIGKGYRAPSRPAGQADETEPGAKVRTHWRRGHLHTVLFGPARSKSRLDWFEPVLVNAPDKEEPKDAP